MRCLLLALISSVFSLAGNKDSTFCFLFSKIAKLIIKLCPDEYCLEDFRMAHGGIAGNGQIEVGIDTDEIGCARLCTKGYEDCCSYEHSRSKNICNLSKDCKPVGDQNEDFKFCVKG